MAVSVWTKSRGSGGDDDDVLAPGRKAREPKARRNIGALPAHLPRCEQVIEPSSTLCPCCATQMRRIGEDVAEALDRVPAQLRVVRTIRPKYACRACEGPDHPGESAGAAGRGRHGHDGADRAYRRDEIRLAIDALSSDRGFWRAGASSSTGRRWRAG